MFVNTTRLSLSFMAQFSILVAYNQSAHIYMKALIIGDQYVRPYYRLYFNDDQHDILIIKIRIAIIFS